MEHLLIILAVVVGVIGLLYVLYRITRPRDEEPLEDRDWLQSEPEPVVAEPKVILLKKLKKVLPKKAAKKH